MVDLTLSGRPSDFSKELKDQLAKNCENIFRYIIDEIIPNIKDLVEIEFDERYMGDKENYFRRYGDRFYMTLWPKTKCSGNNYFTLKHHFGNNQYAYSIFKKLNIKIDKEWLERKKEIYKDDFCADFFKEYGMQLQLMYYWPKVKKQLLNAIEADKKLTSDIQKSINSFEL